MLPTMINMGTHGGPHLDWTKDDHGKSTGNHLTGTTEQEKYPPVPNEDAHNHSQDLPNTNGNEEVTAV